MAIAPDNIEGYCWKAQYLFQAGDTLTAYEIANKGIEKCKNREDVELLKLHLQRGVLGFMSFGKDNHNDFDTALSLYDKIIADDPDNVGAILDSAMVLCYMGKTESAIEYLKTVRSKECQPFVDDFIEQIVELDIHSFFNIES